MSQGTGTVLRIRLLPWLCETKMSASGLFNHARKHHHPVSRVSFCLLPAQGGERRLCACLNCVKHLNLAVALARASGLVNLVLFRLVFRVRESVLHIQLNLSKTVTLGTGESSHYREVHRCREV